MQDNELMLPFPLGMFDNDPDFESLERQFVAGYSSFLKRENEPSLFKLVSDHDNHVYRFAYIPTWQRVPTPIIVRITIQNDGTALANTNTWTWTNETPMDFRHRHPIHKIKQKRISRRNVNRFLRQLEIIGFWELAIFNNAPGADGEWWYFEGVKSGRFHVVIRWSPYRRKDFTDTGVLLLKICGLYGHAWEVGSINREWTRKLSDFLMELLFQVMKFYFKLFPMKDKT